MEPHQQNLDIYSLDFAQAMQLVLYGFSRQWHGALFVDQFLYGTQISLGKGQARRNHVCYMVLCNQERNIQHSNWHRFISTIGNIFASSVAKRLGLIRAMVATHLPSSIFLALLPAPRGLPATIGLLVARATLNSMDQAPRSAFLSIVVLPEERTAVMGVVNILKTLSQSSGPSVTGILAGQNHFWVAFVAAGSLKATYDVLLLVFFGRRIGPDAGGRTVAGLGNGRQGEGDAADEDTDRNVAESESDADSDSLPKSPSESSESHVHEEVQVANPGPSPVPDAAEAGQRSPN